MNKHKKMILAAGVFLALGAALALLFPGGAQAAADPTGASYAAVSGPQAAGETAAVASKAYFGVNFVWVMICAFLVFFFQCGFAMVETGFCRAKNAAHTITMNFMVFLVGVTGYFLCGFALQMGGSGGAAGLGSGGSVLNAMLSIPGLGGIAGGKGFLLNGTYDAGVYALFFFEMVFMDTTVTIPTGAMAERVKYSAVVITSFFISMFLYPMFGNWVWGGGWLATLGKNFGLGHGVVDFSGSAVVHSMGGMIALSGAMVIGPRIGKFKKDGTARAFPGHDIPMAILGTILLFFCWFAFNAGSTLNASDLRLAVVAANTMLSGSIGGLVAMFYMWGKYGKPDPSMTANGVAGNVRGLFYGDASQLGAQLVAMAVLVVWGFGVSYAWFRLLDRVWGLRVSPEIELEGLDLPEMGVLAYPDNSIVRSELDYDSDDNAEIPQLARFPEWNAHRTAPQAPAAMEESVPVVRVPQPAAGGAVISKVDIVTKQSRFEALKAAMNRIGVTGMTVTQVLGCGIQKGRTEYYRGVESEVNLLPKVQVEIVVSKVPVREVIEAAKQALSTGNIGDGKIFVYGVENVVKVRTGEEGYDALQGEE